MDDCLLEDMENGEETDKSRFDSVRDYIT